MSEMRAGTDSKDAIGSANIAAVGDGRTPQAIEHWPNRPFDAMV